MKFLVYSAKSPSNKYYIGVTMPEVVSVTDVTKQFSRLLKGKESVIITKNSVPVSAIISYENYLKLKVLEEKELRKETLAKANKFLSGDESDFIEVDWGVGE